MCSANTEGLIMHRSRGAIPPAAVNDVRASTGCAELTNFDARGSLVYAKGNVLTKMIMIGTARPLVLFSSFALAVTGCNRSADSKQGSTPPAESAQVPNPDAPIMLRGTVVSASANRLVLKSDTGVVTVTLAQPFHLYARAPSDLSQVKERSFIGVTTVKQPDGSERATEIHVFPEELRGMGEGSRMMAPDMSTGASRMTNGNVSASRMTNAMASQSRMSNGNVSRTNGSSLVVQYAGGSQNVTVLANTPVTELKIVSRDLAAGDQVAVLAKKAPDGSLTADKAISTAK
jgi:hypothetical protein